MNDLTVGSTQVYFQVMGEDEPFLLYKGWEGELPSRGDALILDGFRGTVEARCWTLTTDNLKVVTIYLERL